MSSRVYEDHYQFRRQPFSLTPDLEFFYKSDSHQAALEQLLRGIRRREGTLLLTGDVGTGKTTTTRALFRLLDKKVFTALVLDPCVSGDDLARILLQEFGIVSDGSALQDAGRQILVETLNRFLLSLAAVGASALVVVDEAQNLTPPALEQLRVLTALGTDQQKLLQILLVGQPELETMLALPEMRELNQRIARRCTIRSLTCDEVEQYVRFRVRMAGGAWETLFTGRALELIHQFSEGVPRKVNLICDRSLETGFAALSATIDETLVVAAAEALEFTRAGPGAIPSPRPRRRPGRFAVAPQTTRWMATIVGGGGLRGLGLVRRFCCWRRGRRARGQACRRCLRSWPRWPCRSRSTLPRTPSPGCSKRMRSSPWRSTPFHRPTRPRPCSGSWAPTPLLRHPKGTSTATSSGSGHMRRWPTRG